MNKSYERTTSRIPQMFQEHRLRAIAILKAIGTSSLLRENKIYLTQNFICL